MQNAERLVENAKCRIQNKYNLKIQSKMHEATNRKAKSKQKANQQNKKHHQKSHTSPMNHGGDFSVSVWPPFYPFAVSLIK